MAENKIVTLDQYAEERENYRLELKKQIEDAIADAFGKDIDSFTPLKKQALQESKKYLRVISEDSPYQDMGIVQTQIDAFMAGYLLHAGMCDFLAE